MSLYGKVDSAVFKNISATQVFNLVGGCYGITAVATWGGGSVALNRLAADGVTWVPVLAASIAANGFQTLNLPQGSYQLVVTTATAVYCDITSVVVAL